MRGKARLPLPKKTEKVHENRKLVKCKHDWVAERYEGKAYCMDCGATRKSSSREMTDWTEDPDV